VIVEPSGQEAFTIFAQSLDRTGYARGTLAARAGLMAPVPDLDPRPVLTMADMGHEHGSPSTTGTPSDLHADHDSHGPQPDPHAGHNTSPQQPDPHAGHHMPSTGGAVQTHPETERGNPLVDMQAVMPMSRLDDPGIG